MLATDTTVPILKEMPHMYYKYYCTNTEGDVLCLLLNPP